MSWFTSLFSVPPLAPADQAQTREKRLLEEKPPVQTSSSSPAPSDTLASQGTFQQPDRNRNKIIFSAGVAFFAFSLLITRRAFTRRRIASNPAFYTNAPGHRDAQSKSVSGPIEALEALSIATTNVLSLAMMGIGGTLWSLDINSLEEGRRFIRGGLGVDGSGRSEKQAEEDFEEWMATTLARKDAKESQGEK